MIFSFFLPGLRHPRAPEQDSGVGPAGALPLQPRELAPGGCEPPGIVSTP